MASCSKKYLLMSDFALLSIGLLSSNNLALMKLRQSDGVEKSSYASMNASRLSKRLIRKRLATVGLMVRNHGTGKTCLALSQIHLWQRSLSIGNCARLLAAFQKASWSYVYS